MSVELHIFDVKRSADEPPIAQGDFSHAMSNGCDMIAGGGGAILNENG
jgi:hypothetical protein